MPVCCHLLGAQQQCSSLAGGAHVAVVASMQVDAGAACECACACCVVYYHALLAHLQVLKGQIDFKSDPWPKISDAAKDCVKRLLEMDASKRATSEQVGTG